MQEAKSCREYVMRGMCPGIDECPGIDCELIKERRSSELTDCPIKLGQMFCDNCYFKRDGQCKFEEIKREYTTNFSKGNNAQLPVHSDNKN